LGLHAGSVPSAAKPLLRFGMVGALVDDTDQ